MSEWLVVSSDWLMVSSYWEVKQRTTNNQELTAKRYLNTSLAGVKRIQVWQLINY
jgi:hypothetical protein